MTEKASLPENLAIGIVHLGLGAFHRAHQAVFTEQAMLEAGGDWGICAVAMRSRELAQRLSEQGGRYSLIEQQATGPVLREYTVIRDVLCLPDEPEAVAARIADASVHVVTITVTEKGYCFHGSDRSLNENDPLIAHDLETPELPRSMPGILVAGLRKRRQADGSGLTVLSCDNLPANGKLLRQIVLDFAKRLDSTLVTWIETHCRFPDSMVDRITPAANEKTAALALELRGQPDTAALETEPFSQWVIEDDFAGPRPAWEQAGVQIVDDVAPFEDMKLRMLNGAHSLVAYLGAVAGLSAVRDVMQNPLLHRLVDQHMAQAAQTLDGMQAEQSSAYRQRLLERFENPAIDHRCLQIAMDGSQKLPQRIFEPAIIRLQRGLGVDTFALATALWYRYLQGRDEAGGTIACQDPLLPELQKLMSTAQTVPTRIAAIATLPGVPEGLFDRDDWIDQVAGLVDRLESLGVEAVASSLAADVS